MQQITIREAKTSREIREFYKFPFKIYLNDPDWVPPLLAERKHFFDPSKNSFFSHADLALWIAERDGEVVGTISSHVDHNFVKFHEEQTGHFGFFECINDLKVAGALFERAEKFLREKGMKKVIGPFNFTTNHECGLFVDGDEGPPVVMMTYNPPYYAELISGLGYKKEMDLYAYQMDTSDIPPGLEAFAENFLKEDNGVSIRSLNIKNIDVEIAHGRDIYNQAWSKNWGAVPLEESEFHEVIKGLQPIIDPDLCFFAFKDDKPIGFALSIPDVNPVVKQIGGKLFPFGWIKLLGAKKNYNYIRVLVLGVLHDYHDLGIGGVFYYLTWKQALKKNIRGAEMSWILENNKPMRRALEMMGARIYRTYRVYGRDL